MSGRRKQAQRTGTGYRKAGDSPWCRVTGPGNGKAIPYGIYHLAAALAAETGPAITVVFLRPQLCSAV